MAREEPNRIPTDQTGPAFLEANARRAVLAMSSDESDDSNASLSLPSSPKMREEVARRSSLRRQRLVLESEEEDENIEKKLSPQPLSNVQLLQPLPFKLVNYTDSEEEEEILRKKNIVGRYF